MYKFEKHGLQGTSLSFVPSPSTQTLTSSFHSQFARRNSPILHDAGPNPTLSKSFDIFLGDKESLSGGRRLHSGQGAQGVYHRRRHQPRREGQLCNTFKYGTPALWSTMRRWSRVRMIYASQGIHRLRASMPSMGIAPTLVRSSLFRLSFFADIVCVAWTDSGIKSRDTRKPAPPSGTLICMVRFQPSIASYILTISSRPSCLVKLFSLQDQ